MNLKKMINIGIIGYGYWGPNLVRNFAGLEDCTVKIVSDLQTDRLKTLAKIYPAVAITRSADDVFHNKTIDAVVIATPITTHFQLAKKALLCNKHVLVEKPLTTSVVEAEKLLALSEKKHKVLMVDHTYLYNGAVKKIKELIKKGEIGKIKYFDSTRINLGLFQSDINVLWDLAPHDLAIIYYLIDKKPLSVQALGVSHLRNGLEDIAYLILRYRGGMIAHFNCSWSSPVKIRTILIGGDKKMIVYNDMEPTEKVKVYDCGYSLKKGGDKRKILVDYRIGDIFIPKTETEEALKAMAADFICSIKTKKEPISSAQLGIEVVRVLEASVESLKKKSKEVKI